ncbi:MAG: response regulator transcription factor [Acidobacteriota bacterium]|nr:response regulator transcription factor [Acidobacteriota bacterium]MDH3785999.1 response regulator transcription factor [Acidobacteriota bacterium]
MSLRVLLADDHTLVRAGIRSLLESIPGVEVVAEADDGREALELIAKRRPDVALLDIGMPGLNGLELAKRVPHESPKTKIIILSMHADANYVNQALRAGVHGYLLKGAAVSELPLALSAVTRGETYLTPKVSRFVVDGFLSGEEAGPLEGLTRRQCEILQLIAEGNSTKEIAGMLDLGVKTVETHRSRLMDRLDIHDVAGLVRFAIRAGLVTPEG